MSEQEETLNNSVTEIMGVLNLTEDSFFSASREILPEKAALRAYEMFSQGADYIDVGAESSRPFADPVPEERELELLTAFLEKVDTTKIPLSIDSSRRRVIEECLKAGVSMINDIYALGREEGIAELVADYDCKVVLMHMQGTPENMQVKPVYENVIDDIKAFLSARIEYAVKKGISEARIILDPGIGFGKTFHDNLDILKNIKQFQKMGFPVLAGTSRKSFIGEITGKEVEQRLFGTLGSFAWLLHKKVDIVRLHDVAEANDMLKVYRAIEGFNECNV